MSRDLYRLMSQRPEDWQSAAVCHGDDRFTKARSQLSDSDLLELEDVCLSCPVFVKCLDEWVPSVVPGGATDVFAAGEWREAAGCASE